VQKTLPEARRDCDNILSVENGPGSDSRKRIPKPDQTNATKRESVNTLKKAPIHQDILGEDPCRVKKKKKEGVALRIQEKQSPSSSSAILRKNTPEKVETEEFPKREIQI